jgi:hypothetical protein
MNYTRGRRRLANESGNFARRHLYNDQHERKVTTKDLFSYSQARIIFMSVITAWLIYLLVCLFQYHAFTSQKLTHLETITGSEIKLHQAMSAKVDEAWTSPTTSASSPINTPFTATTIADTTTVASPILLNSTTLSTKYAYAVFISDCDPNIPFPEYKFLILNLLVTSHTLKKHGSSANVVAFFQMSFNSNMTMLPNDDAEVLRMAGICFNMIPPSPNESVYRSGLDQFRVLDLLQYRRVIVLNPSVMPFRSLDYLFELSCIGPEPI